MLGPCSPTALTALGGDWKLFKPLIDSLLFDDEYMLLADYQSYIDCQDEVTRTFQDQQCWTRMSILNVASMGRFSSDRAIREYVSLIWDVKPVKVNIGGSLIRVNY